MSSSIQLIVGLANPGKEYADTRHNAGAWFVEQTIADNHVTLRNESKFHGRYCQAKIGEHNCHLLIPNTYMNLSGRAVRACLNYLKLAPSQLLIVHDEIDLDPGTIRLKFDGGDGGHNGLKDIIANLGTKQFYRLRIGVGHPGKSDDVADYVLSKPSKSDRQLIDQTSEFAQTTLPLILQGEIQKAMQQLHTETS